MFPLQRDQIFSMTQNTIHLKSVNEDREDMLDIGVEVLRGNGL